MLFLTSCVTNTNAEKDKVFLNLDLQSSNKNKEIILEYLLKENIKFSIDFNKEDSYEIDDDLLKSNLKYFCRSFIQDQNNLLETAIFDSSNSLDKKVLIIYSKDFNGLADDLKKKYPNELYHLLDKNNYDKEIKRILDVNGSISRYMDISNLDKNLKIVHSLRIRDDISKIYFLLNYDLGKTIVPLVKNFALNIDSYSSSQIFHGASDFKKISDFENIFIPIQDEMIETIVEKEDIKNIKREFEKMLIADYLLIEKVYQNNLFRQKIFLKTTSSQIIKNKCISRNLSLSKII
jgi:hypothetical protein